MRPGFGSQFGLQLLWRRVVHGLDDSVFAQRFLGQWKGDPVAMSELRRLLQEWPQGTEIARLSDDQVVAQVAGLIESGQLLAGFDSNPLVIGPGATPMQEASPPPPSSSSARPAEESEASTFPANLASAAQAATLVAAADAGVPFCDQ